MVQTPEMSASMQEEVLPRLSKLNVGTKLSDNNNNNNNNNSGNSGNSGNTLFHTKHLPILI